MPFDEMATDHHTGTLDLGACLLPATNCATCHTTKGWDSASFDHSTTGFRADGHACFSFAHRPALPCHVSNNYTLNSADCMGCHQAAWNTTPSFWRQCAGSHQGGVSPRRPLPCAPVPTTITKWGRRASSITPPLFGFPLTNSHALVADGGKVPSCAFLPH